MNLMLVSVSSSLCVHIYASSYMEKKNGVISKTGFNIKDFFIYTKVQSMCLLEREREFPIKYLNLQVVKFNPASLGHVCS